MYRAEEAEEEEEEEPPPEVVESAVPLWVAAAAVEDALPFEAAVAAAISCCAPGVAARSVLFDRELCCRRLG